jgi:hypothetical protein
MSAKPLEERVAALEQEVAILKARVDASHKAGQANWVDKITGLFANDPAFDEAMRLGRKYRESQRPKLRKQKKK